jgi:hypothetical protein
MEPFDDVREFARAKKFDLIFWIILMMIVMAICGVIWASFSRAAVDMTTRVVSAKPGETVSLKPDTVHIDVRVEMAGNVLPIGGDRIYLEDQGSSQLTCENGVITARRGVYDGVNNPPFGLSLVNHCNADVTLKACWYNSTSWLRFLAVPGCE